MKNLLLLTALFFATNLNETELPPSDHPYGLFAKTSALPVVDIGAAFGVASIAALKGSTCPVIADDIGIENLFVLRNVTEETYRDRLYLNGKRFPQELDFPAESIGGVLICRVF